MPRKKQEPPKFEPHPFEVTPELHQRAVEALTEDLLDMAYQRGTYGNKVIARRDQHGMAAPSCAHVAELVAQMALSLAKSLADGSLTPRPINQ